MTSEERVKEHRPDNEDPTICYWCREPWECEGSLRDTIEALTTEVASLNREVETAVTVGAEAVQRLTTEVERHQRAMSAADSIIADIMAGRQTRESVDRYLELRRALHPQRPERTE